MKTWMKQLKNSLSPNFSVYFFIFIGYILKLTGNFIGCNLLDVGRISVCPPPESFEACYTMISKQAVMLLFFLCLYVFFRCKVAQDNLKMPY